MDERGWKEKGWNVDVHGMLSIISLCFVVHPCTQLRLCGVTKASFEYKNSFSPHLAQEGGQPVLSYQLMCVCGGEGG